MVDGLGNEGGDVAVPLCPLVYWMIVLHGLELAVLLFDEEEVCCIGTP